MSRKAENAEATRRALVEAARGLFAERGYAATSVEAIVGSAGVTKGALYHHFLDKHDLFRAVFEELMRELVGQINAAALREDNAWGRLRAASHAFLDACLEPAIHRVVLVDAPSVLGWELWREIDAEHSFGHVRATLRAAMREGALEQQPVNPLAHIVVGALNEAALVIARAPNARRARREMGTAVDRLLEGLRRQPAAAK